MILHGPPINIFSATCALKSTQPHHQVNVFCLQKTRQTAMKSEPLVIEIKSEINILNVIVFYL